MAEFRSFRGSAFFVTMQYIYTPTPQEVHTSLLCGAKLTPRGPFWDAYDHIRGDDMSSASNILREEYLDEEGHRSGSKRLGLIYSLCHDDGINLSHLDWPQLLAAANNQSGLVQLYRAGRILGVQAVSAMLDFGHAFPSLRLFEITRPEASTLLQLYDLEMDVILSSPQTDEATLTWLVQRQARAEEYLEPLADIYVKT